MTSSPLELSRRTRRAISWLTAGAGLSLGIALTVAQTMASADAGLMQMGKVLNTPGKHFMAEHALGMRDGLAALGVTDAAIDARLDPIVADRDPMLAQALGQVYEEGYQGAERGRYGLVELDAAVIAIETGTDIRVDQMELDASDDAIFEAFTRTAEYAANLSGPAAGEAMMTLMMIGVAHDELREAFGRYTGVPVFGANASRSLENFLTLTGVLPGDFAEPELAETIQNSKAGPGPEEIDIRG